MADATLERARSALSYLNPDCDRETWVKYAMCLKAEFGDSAFEIWDDWSSQSDKYRASDARSTWKSVKGGGGRGLGSLIYDAKQSGWQDTDKPKRPTAAELAARRAAAEARQRAADEQDAQRHAAAANHALAIWESAQPATSHPYLDRKGVQSYGLRVGAFSRLDQETGEITTLCEDGLLIPIRDRQRALWSLQCIPADPKRLKLYLKDGAKRGNFFSIGKAPLQHDGRQVFVLGEGYATCASVHGATGHLVLCCFDVSNLDAVARQLRAAKPDAIILFAADNDEAVKDNPGVSISTAVALTIGGHQAIPPPGDFNDLQQAEGAEAVAALIDAALDAGPVKAPKPAEPASAPAPAPAAATDGLPADEEPSGPAPKLPRDPDAETALSNNGYFSILGYDGCTYYVFSYAKMQLVEVSKGDFSEIGMAELAPLNWWEQSFPGTRGCHRPSAFEWFIGAAHNRGIFDPRRIRGRGAWADDGRVIYHRGDRLLVDGVETLIPHLRSSFIYPMARSMPTSQSEPLSDADGRYLLSVAETIRWKRPAAAAMLAGWAFLAPICGALPWRPHVWLTGPAGSGKSSIYESFVQCLTAGIAEAFQGDSSEAGIRQTLGSDAVPVLVDEFEPNDPRDRDRLKSVLTMIRQSSSESASRTAKGSATGEATRYHIRSSFCLASINTMLDKDADQSRIAVLELRAAAKPGSSDDRWPQLSAEFLKLGKDKTLPSRILSRGLAMMPLVLKTVDVFRDVAAVRFGTQRQGDQYGTLIAGAWCLTSSKVPTQEEAKSFFSAYDWTDHQDIGDGLSDPEKALGAILEAKVRWNSVDVTIHEVISEASGQPTGSTGMGVAVAEDLLRRNGMRIEGGMLLFGTSTVALRKLAADTSFATDIRGQLSRLPGASTMENKTRKFAGVNSKVIGIPVNGVLDDQF